MVRGSTTSGLLAVLVPGRLDVPPNEDAYFGFRVASVPEPSTAVLAIMALGCFGC